MAYLDKDGLVLRERTKDLSLISNAAGLYGLNDGLWQINDDGLIYPITPNFQISTAGRYAPAGGYLYQDQRELMLPYCLAVPYGVNNMDVAALPLPETRRFASVRWANASTPALTGISSATATAGNGNGLLSPERTIADTGFNRRIPAVQYARVSADNSGAKFGFVPSFFNMTRTDHEPELNGLGYVEEGFDTETASIWWLGFFSAAPPNTATPGGVSYVAFRYLLGTDAGWVGTTSDGASVTLTTNMNTPSYADLDLMNHFRIRIESGVAYFSINFGTEVSISTTMPSSSTGLAPVHTIRCATANFVRMKGVGFSVTMK